MLAPNGARRGKADHPALPVSVAEVVAAARAAQDAGAGALHAHVRDAEGRHVLDAGLYRELIAEMAAQVPQMPVQVTTEAVGRYSPEAQCALVRALEPEGVSVALREMVPEAVPERGARDFYRWAEEAGIAVQHILYAPAEVARLAALVAAGDLPPPRQVLYVLGHYAPPVAARPEELEDFLAAGKALGAVQWAVCAFGAREQDCLVHAARQGGAMRIGFENNIARPDGRPARDNAAQVAALLRALEAA
jgi:uncharacterized protein (DUF849 family)